MNASLLIFLFAFGLIIGSFLNVVILRYNTGKSLEGRSACFSCGQTLKWHHLIPLVSFITQRGRCAFCSSKISIQYPLVELATGLLFLKLGYILLGTVPPVQFIVYLIATSLLVVIFVYDLRHKIIPDGVVFALAGLGFIQLLLRHTTPFDAQGAGVDLLSALVIFIFFFSLWYLSKGTWMGLGDGKLAFAIGLFLPWAQNLSAIIISFWIGAAFGLLIMAYERLVRRKKIHSMRSELPFAPFMIIAFFLVLFTQLNLITLLVV